MRKVTLKKDTLVVPICRGIVCDPLLYERMTEIVAADRLRRDRGEPGYSLKEIAYMAGLRVNEARVLLDKIHSDDRRIQAQAERIRDIAATAATAPGPGKFDEHRDATGNYLHPLPGTDEAARHDAIIEADRKRFTASPSTGDAVSSE